MNGKQNIDNSFFKDGENKEKFWKLNYAKIWMTLYTATYSFCPNKAKDIVAEVIVKLLKQDFQVLLALQNPRAYLVMAARNQSNSHFQKLKNSREADFEIIENDKCSTTNQIKAVEVSIDLENALRQLTLEQSEVFRLRLQGYSIKEIAELLGISFDAARGRYDRARKRLRSLLK